MAVARDTFMQIMRLLVYERVVPYSRRCSKLYAKLLQKLVPHHGLVFQGLYAFMGSTDVTPCRHNEHVPRSGTGTTNTSSPLFPVNHDRNTYCAGSGTDPPLEQFCQYEIKDNWEYQIV